MDEKLLSLAKMYEDKMKNYYEASLGLKKKFPKAICNLTHQKPCKLCSLNSEIYKKVKANLLPTEILDVLHRLTRRFYSNVVLISEPSKVRIFEFGVSILKDLVPFQLDPLSDYKDWLSPTEGRDIIIRKIMGATKRNTSYQIMPKATPSKLIDMSVLDKMFPLDKLLENYSAWSTFFLRLRDLPVGSTEIRFLPSWLGAQFSKVFFVEIDFHYGITQEDYDMIEGGLNPYEVYLKPQKSYADLKEEPKVEPKEVKSEESVTPSCFGSYVMDSELCEKCKARGLYQACKLFSVK